jgi:hypothetical protein
MIFVSSIKENVLYSPFNSIVSVVNALEELAVGLMDGVGCGPRLDNLVNLLRYLFGIYSNIKRI